MVFSILFLCGWEASIADFGPVNPGSNPREAKFFFPNFFFIFMNPQHPRKCSRVQIKTDYSKNCWNFSHFWILRILIAQQCDYNISVVNAHAMPISKWGLPFLYVERKAKNMQFKRGKKKFEKNKGPMIGFEPGTSRTVVGRPNHLATKYAWKIGFKICRVFVLIGIMTSPPHVD